MIKVKNGKIGDNRSRAYKTNAKMHFQSKISPKSKKPQFQAILGQNFPKNIFSKIGPSHILCIAILHHCAKNQKKTNDKISRKVQKTQILGHFGPKFAQKFFFENQALSHFGNCHFASLCKKSEKTNERIPRKACNRRTDERTDGQQLIYRTSARQVQKDFSYYKVIFFQFHSVLVGWFPPP